MLRRAFLRYLGGGSLAAAAAPAGPRIPLGLDAYSIRAFEWKAMRLLEYAASLKLDSIQLSAPGDYESIEPAHLAGVRERAAALGLAIDAAIGKICPTTGRWTQKESPEQYARMGLRVARAVGARQMRCFVGGFESRGGDPPFAAHMESTLKVLRAVRSEALDLGVRIGIENHGDFEARELRRLIEEAGSDFTGCCLDTGNPLRVLEDPLTTLEVLAPYVVSSHVRDSVVYEHPRGAAFQWVALGDGCIDFRGFSTAFGRLCPDIPMQLEVITGRPPTVLPYLEPGFWKAFPDKPAADFARFLALARNGRPFAGAMMIGGAGKQPPAYEAALKEQQRVDVNRSVAHGRSALGLGRKS